MSWLYLLIAGILEIVWSTALKYSEGFSKLIPSIITVAGMIVGFLFLAKATKVLPMGTAYVVWTGIGAVGAFIVGVILFKEQLNIARVAFVCCILIGIIGLKMTSA